MPRRHWQVLPVTPRAHETGLGLAWATDSSGANGGRVTVLSCHSAGRPVTTAGLPAIVSLSFKVCDVGLSGSCGPRSRPSPLTPFSPKPQQCVLLDMRKEGIREDSVLRPVRTLVSLVRAKLIHTHSSLQAARDENIPLVGPQFG